MKIIKNVWFIVDVTRTPIYLLEHTCASNKKECIKEFLAGWPGHTWKEVKSWYGYKCVKAKIEGNI